MIERTIVVGPFQCNCRLLACPKTGEALLLDPGDEPGRLIKAVEKEKLPSGAPIRVKHLFHTHGHLDHIAATREVRETLGAQAAGAPEIWLHRDDEPLYRQLKMQGGLFGLKYDDPLPVDRFFEDAQELTVGELKFTVLHTAGHSPGSVCLRLHEDSGAQIPESLYSGDTLFAGSVGRTDLWGANQDLMFKNIHGRLLTLDGDTRVCPGHGPDSTIGVEKRENPFLI
jgi:glyoxylase-like metal-dependent hydrolase (beta-lactamase superfamily II)